MKPLISLSTELVPIIERSVGHGESQAASVQGPTACVAPARERRVARAKLLSIVALGTAVAGCSGRLPTVERTDDENVGAVNGGTAGAHPVDGGKAGELESGLAGAAGNSTTAGAGAAGSAGVAAAGEASTAGSGVATEGEAGTVATGGVATAGEAGTAEVTGGSTAGQSGMSGNAGSTNAGSGGRAGGSGAASGGDGGTGGDGSGGTINVLLYCGDSAITEGEGCDDGNAFPGDGCSALCAIEQYYECLTPGEPCESTIACGDREVQGEEACDDGNAAAGDGCSSDCLSIETGFTCPTWGGIGGSCSPVSGEHCGDGYLQFGEDCDDGNAIEEDGCSSACELTIGYDCAVPGTPCVLVEWCGDGRQTGTEECDDGSVDGVPVGGDGCTTQCQLEADFICPTPGGSCISLIECGDDLITGDETCDDGEAIDGDGCSATCQVEEGWECSPNAPCRPALCGDGVVVGFEQCDDGNSAAGDGCSMACELEEGFSCAVAGADCVPTVCHDGVVEGTEQCDDDNYDTGDGCSPDCRLEPSCTDGTCTAQCGDGLKLETESCDDGNTLSGDGCSELCEVEPGFTCEVVLDSPTLPIVYRDFIGTVDQGVDDPVAENTGPLHLDFEKYSGGEGGCPERGEFVEHFTDAEGKPALADANGCVESAESFAQWYRTSDTINRTLVGEILLSPVDGSPDTYEYFNDLFWPINELGFNDPADLQELGRAGKDAAGEVLEGEFNFHFTSELRYWFTYRGGERLTFYGDDDVWVFINGHLAVEIAGVHARRERWIELPSATTVGGTGAGAENEAETTTFGYFEAETLEIEIGGVYDVAVFHAERSTTQSQYRLTLQNFLSGGSSCAASCGDGIVASLEACDLGTAANTGAYGTCMPDCTLPPRCGDAEVESTEEACDDGINLTVYEATGAGCAPNCQVPRHCGDGVVDGLYGEACDDGAANGRAESGCTSTCKLAPVCGNATIDEGELCDDGALNGTSTSPCSDTCTPLCGNGIPDAGEDCDDGTELNTGGYGACSPQCTLGLYCGDGLRSGTEECDDATNDGSYGTCNADCTFAGYCGDGTSETPAEECDDGAANVPMGTYGTELCRESTCTIAPYCGDGIVQPEFGEECDGGTHCEQCRLGS